MIPLPVIWSLIRRFWWLIPVTAICVTASVYRIQRDNARSDLAAANAAVARLEAAGRAQAERTAIEQAANDKAVARLLEEKNATLAAIDADRVRLSDSLRDAYARASRGPVREADPGAIADAVAARIAGRAAEIDAALDAYDRACRRDAERLGFWIEYAQRLGVEVSDPR